MVINHILKKLAENLNCSIHVFDKFGNIKLCHYNKMISVDSLETDNNLYAWLYQELGTKNDVAVILEDEVFIYGVFKDAEEWLYVFGPVVGEKVSRSKVYEYRKKHNISDNKYQLSVNTGIAMANILSIAVGIVLGKEISEEQILGLGYEEELNKQIVEDWDVVKYNISQAENGQSRISYKEEQQILDNIRNGNADFFNKNGLKELESTKLIGKMASNDQKQWEYMAVTSIALATRAAIDGGLRPFIAYSVSDLYLQRLEKNNHIAEIMQMIPSMQRDFSERVKNNRKHKKKIYYIEQCKDIVAQNVHQPITIEDIAILIGINRSYLSRKFAEQEGMSISSYIVNVRLNAAENMLKYSDFNIQMISDYFCFSSQSYFISLFKKKNGVTPFVYRQNNRVIDFLNRETKITKK